MRQTHVHVTRVGDVRVVDKFHPKGQGHNYDSYEQVAGIKGRHGAVVTRRRGPVGHNYGGE